MISFDERSGHILYKWKTGQTAVHVEAVCAGGQLVFRGLGTVTDLGEDNLVIGVGASIRGLPPGLWDLTLRLPDGATAKFSPLQPISSDAVVEIKSEQIECTLHGPESY